MGNSFVTYGNQRVVTDAKTGEEYVARTNSAETTVYIENPTTGKVRYTVTEGAEYTHIVDNETGEEFDIPSSIDSTQKQPITKSADGTITGYLDLKTGTITDADGGLIQSFTDQQPGVGSEELFLFDKYTHRQIIGLNNALADLCSDIAVVEGKDFGDLKLPQDPDFSKVLVFNGSDGTEYNIIPATWSLHPTVHVVKRTSTGYEYVESLEIIKHADGFIDIDRHYWRYNTNKGEWDDIESEIKVAKYKLKKVPRSDGRLNYYHAVNGSETDAPSAAITPPMALYDQFDDCEERINALYGKNNKKESTTAKSFKMLKNADSISTGTSSTSSTATSNNISANVTNKNTWSFQTASASFSDASRSSSSSSTLSGSSWSWSKPVTILSSYGASSNKSKSSSSSDASKKKADGVKDAIDKLFGKVASFFTKDTNTAKGEDLKEDEPLSVPDISSEKKTLASFLSSTPGTNVKEATREAVLYAAAIDRQKVAYGKGRKEYQNEHQTAADNRKSRIAAKQSRIKNAIKVDVTDAANWA